MTFLSEFSLRQVRIPEGCPFNPVGLAIGEGSHGLEVLVADHSTSPSLPTLRSCWKQRHGGRAAPLLLVVLCGDKAALCGPTGFNDDPPAYVNIDPGQVERICIEALEQPDRHSALRALRDSMPAVDSKMAGIRNEGFLASHELISGVPARLDWPDAVEKGRKHLSRKGEDLLKALEYQVERFDQNISILRTGEKKVGVAVLLRKSESPELQAERFQGLSPVSYALSIADKENLPYVVVCHESKIRVYPTAVGVGVGQRGRTETYLECHTGLLKDTDAGYLWLLFSAKALLDGGTLDQILDASERFSGDLAEGLRDRIYQNVVPILAAGIVQARNLQKITAQDLADTYEMTLTVLFRLLFIAYAEDKDLLPYKWNGLYQRRSLKTKATEILEILRANGEFDDGDSLWDEISRLFRAVDQGNKEWGVPPYNGGLFASDPELFSLGAELAELTIPNTITGPVLKDLFLVETSEGLGPVDFRSLGVREFGTIYEGLLESELSVAESDLTTDREGTYRPCSDGEDCIVETGEVYLHNASGARKATGSYFTKAFAVEHLLERALEPALEEHLERLDEMDDDRAAETLFDFRVADIAMGSGHFQVAAIDHIEKAFTGYLAKRILPGTVQELATLRASAIEALGPIADQVEIEDTQLLRRLIARRCVYGVDINPVAVQLARLGIWIHTFVPGLPLSFLDRNLTCANSLVGIGQVAELEDAVKEQSGTLLTFNVDTLLGPAREPLSKLGQINDATLADIMRARKMQEEARRAIAPAMALMDIVTARRIDPAELPFSFDEWEALRGNIVGSDYHKKSRKILGELEPFHFPVAFPEVFLRSRPGFDVILGNPPWEEATVEEDAFWARHFPGLRGLGQRSQETEKAGLRSERPDLVELYEAEKKRAETLRAALVSGPYPGMGTGDPDLYKAFCWRFWNLAAADGGRIGVVIPRSALSAKGSTDFRLKAFEEAETVDITMLLNNRQWFFEDVHPQYTIGLVAVERRASEKPNDHGTVIAISGPYSSRERYNVGSKAGEPAVFYGDEVLNWNDTASLPLLPTDESVEVFKQLRLSPRIDLSKDGTWAVRPHTELHATNEKNLMDLESESCPSGFWPVYKGESFDIWEPDTGKYYAWADPETLLPYLQNKRLRGMRRAKSVFAGFSPEILRDEITLPCLHPRIVFRDITRATDSRTMRCALVPPNVFITNKGPYLLLPRGDHSDEAYVLGVLSSLSLDWYARRFVEIGMNYYIFNPFPVPRPEKDSPLYQRTVSLAGRLACPDDRFAQWAEQVGVECCPLDPDGKEDMIHELDSVVAHLYGLNEKQLVHIFETFHEGWDYEERLKNTLNHFNVWKNKL